MALFSDPMVGNFGNRGSRSPEGDAANAIWNALSQYSHGGGAFRPQGVAGGMPGGGGGGQSPQYSPQSSPLSSGGGNAVSGSSFGGSVQPQAASTDVGSAASQKTGGMSVAMGSSAPAPTPQSSEDDPEKLRRITQGV